MTTGRSKIKKDADLNPEEMRARSVAKLTQYIETNERAEQFGVGHWVKPKGFEDWHFVRFDNRLGFHMETARSMREQGYVDAPKGTRLIGFEQEWEVSVFLCAPPEVKLALRDRKEQARLARARLVNDSFDGHLAGIENIAGSGSVSVKKSTIQGPAPKV